MSPLGRRMGICTNFLTVVFRNVFRQKERIPYTTYMRFLVSISTSRKKSFWSLIKCFLDFHRVNVHVFKFLVIRNGERNESVYMNFSIFRNISWSE